MKKFLKVLKWTGIVLGVLIIALVAFVQLTWNKKLTAPYPQIVASTDSAVIARGRYLAYGPAHCASCHMPVENFMEIEKGAQLPLIGGWGLEISGFGTFTAPNLTPDIETGIGNRTDEELARSLRHSVGYDGRFLMPFMPFQEMSDEDLTAVLSFLRSQDPVKHEVTPSRYGFMGKAIIALGLIKPEGPKSTPPQSVAIDSTIEYGKYLANSVGNCRFCHTEFDMNTGKQTGPDFAGGGLFPPDNLSGGYAFISPNITPDASTGVFADWSEEAFVARFRAGRVHQGSPMPWGSFSRMNEVDLKALYRYLHSLEPKEYKVDKTVFAPGEKMPD
jgi:mono/diheme cytochrome c family protein